MVALVIPGIILFLFKFLALDKRIRCYCSVILCGWIYALCILTTQSSYSNTNIFIHSDTLTFVNKVKFWAKDGSVTRTIHNTVFLTASTVIDLYKSAEDAVVEWLESNFSIIERNPNHFPDFFVYSGDIKYGFDVKVLNTSHFTMSYIRNNLRRASSVTGQDGCNDISIMLVVPHAKYSDEIVARVRAMKQRYNDDLKGNLNILVGTGS